VTNRPRTIPAEALTNRVAVATAPGLAVLLGLPRMVLPVTVAVVLLVGLAAGGVVGLVLLLALAALLGWLLAAFWPVTPPSGRLLRLAVVLGIALIGVLKAG
jgi:hypothetical protein